jgi:hypothetical protein
MIERNLGYYKKINKEITPILSVTNKSRSVKEEIDNQPMQDK